MVLYQNASHSRIERIGLLGDSDPQKWQMAWVAEDLKYVDKSKKIVVAMHAPMTSAGLNPIVTLSGGNERRYVRVRLRRSSRGDWCAYVR